MADAVCEGGVMAGRVVATLAALLAAPTAVADAPVDPNMVILPWCQGAPPTSECGKNSPSRVAVRAEFAASPECAGLTLENDGQDARGRWVLEVETEVSSGRYQWGLRTAVYAPPPSAFYTGTGTPREIVRRVCTIVGRRGGNVVE